ncbi:DUF6471 domain-containing protein [Burkholderia multivorans]|uniref:DUF6471 domain-containing protein n=1 Tax=Burkholderia multivorans TaxID=87883 RepID=UPI00209E7E12|nr:DUF6471 domain-containing protein [Burkholderia multivorans]MCO8458206.1 hypothetical protein [Burkholderia multivorans]MCO8589680.1 hypothetical protein [Burkholderia multivorans]MCO8609650.1 hypothetical protein [Burkholderia multivorans]MCO8646215.1 hypothetical protein [Burkholderia multivorans]
MLDLIFVGRGSDGSGMPLRKWIVLPAFHEVNESAAFVTVQFSRKFSNFKSSVSGETDMSWAGLASRVIRVALAREGCSYGELIDALAAIDVHEDERPLIARVARGSVKFTLLLQIIRATGAHPPTLWAEAFALQDTWEARAQAVLAAELAQQPWVTPNELLHRLAVVGVSTTVKTMISHLSAGDFSLTFFLQCMAVLRSQSMDAYVDPRALVSTAMQGVSPTTE